LCDVALVQRGATHDLHVEVALADGATGCLPDRGEGLREQFVQGLAVLQTLLEGVRLRTQLGVGQLLEVLLDGVDLGSDALEPLDLPTLTGAQHALHQLHEPTPPAVYDPGTARCRARGDRPQANRLWASPSTCTLGG